jgi:hypothetical protein
MVRSEMLASTTLSPPSGMGFYWQVVLIKNNIVLNGTSLDWSKDITGPTGQGTITIGFRGDYEEILAEGDIISIQGVWVDDIRVEPSQLEILVQGIIKNVKVYHTTIDIDFTDFGILLEAPAVVGKYTAQTPDGPFNFNFTGNFTTPAMNVENAIKGIITAAGLYYDLYGWGSNPNPTVTNITETLGSSNQPNVPGNDSVTASTICINAVKSCGCSGTGAYSSTPTYQCWDNQCANPACNKVGTLVISTKGSQGDGVYHNQINCLLAKGGCDCDYCGVYGYELSGECAFKLTPAGDSSSGGSSSGSKAATVSEVNQQSGSSSSQSVTTWWDYLTELVYNEGLDLECIVKGETCYVLQPLPSSEASMLIQDDLNLVSGSVTETLADPCCFNTIVVSYGQTTYPQTVTAKNQDMINEYGVMKGPVIDKPNLNADQAQLYANRYLQQLERNDNYELDCTVIGIPNWFIGVWSDVIHQPMGINRTLFVTKFDFKIDKDAPKIDLTLADYIPTITSSLSSSSSSSSSSNSTIATIQAQFDKFTDTQNGSSCPCDSCSDISCIETQGTGDCWAASAWLYQQLTAAGIEARIMQCWGTDSSEHRYVEYNLNGTWTEWDYSTGHHFGSSACAGSSSVYQQD